MIVKGNFHSREEPRTCVGEMEVQLESNEIKNDCRGHVTVKYTGGIFRPPVWVPNPLPSLPIRAKYRGDGEYDLDIETSIWKPWQKIFHLVGLSVRIAVHEDKIQGIYNVRGGIGIPKDDGIVTAIIVR